MGEVQCNETAVRAIFPVMQFERAEYAAGNTGPACSTCERPATPEYHQLNGRVYCGACRAQIEQSIQNMHGSGNLPRAFLYGLGAAILGSIIFYAVSALSGYEFGLIAVAVGWLVGKAVRKGSGALGGWRYQALAMALTYLSIVSTYAPPIVRGLAERGHAVTAASYPTIVLLAAASPFLGGFGNILGMVIIGIGLWEAWKFNRRVDVRFSGPFAVT